MERANIRRRKSNEDRPGPSKQRKLNQIDDIFERNRSLGDSNPRQPASSGYTRSCVHPSSKISSAPTTNTLPPISEMLDPRTTFVQISGSNPVPYGPASRRSLLSSEVPEHAEALSQIHDKRSVSLPRGIKFASASDLQQMEQQGVVAEKPVVPTITDIINLDEQVRALLLLQDLQNKYATSQKITDRLKAAYVASRLDFKSKYPGVLNN